MLESMTSKQLTEWMAFFKIENERIESHRDSKSRSTEGEEGPVDDRLKQALKDVGALNKAREANAQKRSQS